ncbi:MAG: hypothetical protein K0S35_1510 [Geminicoccaceae bacterium]|nr:hypothetical protein [Geminicoccaceae bacterium]
MGDIEPVVNRRSSAPVRRSLTRKRRPRGMLLQLVGRREQLDHGRIIGPELGLRHALPPAPALASELWLLTHPGLRRSARVRALMDSLA